MFDRFSNRITLRGTLTTQTALRIGAGRATEVTGTDLPVVRDAFNRPYIPGSSFKGALRALIESLVRGVVAHRKGACIPTSEPEQCLIKGTPRLSEDKNWSYPANGVSPHETVGIGDLEAGLRKNDPKWDAKFSQRVKKESCLVCQVFGSPWLAAKVSVCDLLVNEGLWFGQFEQRNGVAIDRETETAADKKLYDFEVVPAGTQFKCEIVVENAEDWELGLLMMGLRPFERGEAALGGARSRGLGVVKVQWDSRKQIGGGDALLDYLEGKDGAADIKDDDVNGWVSQFRHKLKTLTIAEEGEVNAQEPVQ